MLIDDEGIDNFINEKMIKTFSFAENVLIHTSAKSALEFLKNVSLIDNAKDFYPEFIFVDLNMPMLDGFQFLDLLQKSDYPEKHVKVFILTASLNPVDQEKAKEYNQVIGFLQKPLSRETLLKIT